MTPTTVKDVASACDEGEGELILFSFFLKKVNRQLLGCRHDNENAQGGSKQRERSKRRRSKKKKKNVLEK